MSVQPLVASALPTLYRRALPAALVPFASAEGRRIFAQALGSGGLDGYFRLAEQFHTQAEPTFCGLGTLVTALNALGIDPARTWKGPWRWFSEELLDCCVPLELVRSRGIELGELARLARCNGARVALAHSDEGDIASFREMVQATSAGDGVLVAAYDRAALGQTGSGHFSPLGGYHAQRDLVLVLDVARFKYPPHWVPLTSLWRAMSSIDSATGRSRGYLVLHAAEARADSPRCVRTA